MANQRQVKRIHILNKFGPYDNAITGRSADELAFEFTQAGHQVIFFCIKDSYKTLGQAKATQKQYEVNSLRKISFGDKGKRRLATALLDGLRLTVKSLFKKADFVILMTDPPLLNLWSGIFRIFSRRRILFWTMDLYPDAFVSSGIISTNNALYKYLNKRIYTNAPHGMIALGEQQLKYLHSKYQKNVPALVLPCGVETVIQDKIHPDWISAEDNKKIKFCYAGNIGEAHDEQFLTTFIRALNPDKHIIYINLYGSKAITVLQAIENCSSVRKISYLSYGQMHFIDVHLASLSKQWDHVCVPSKAVSAICAGAVLLLNTSKMCDGWNMFKDACWLIEQTKSDYKSNVDDFLNNITPEQIFEKKQFAIQLAQQLEKKRETSYIQALAWIDNGL